jgi:hypothetical protein
LGKSQQSVKNLGHRMEERLAMCMGKKKVPTPEPIKAPEPAPKEVDEAVLKARRDTRQMAAAAQGYASTIVTSPLGDLSTPSTAKTKTGA